MFKKFIIFLAVCMVLMVLPFSIISAQSKIGYVFSALAVDSQSSACTYYAGAYGVDNQTLLYAVIGIGEGNV